jgi:hypothetical protein
VVNEKILEFSHIKYSSKQNIIKSEKQIKYGTNTDSTITIYH